jgi:hypothetical protein
MDGMCPSQAQTKRHQQSNGEITEIQELSRYQRIETLLDRSKSRDLTNVTKTNPFSVKQNPGKRAFRATKRTSTSSDYQKTEAERLQRLSKKLTGSSGEGTEQAPDQEMQIDQGSENPEDSASKPAPKVTTHGPRMSGREVWKASKRGKSY